MRLSRKKWMMEMHELMMEIEEQSKKQTILHRVDSRIMIIFAFALIIYAVIQTELYKLIILEIFLLVLMAVARLSGGYVAKRLALIFPFGGFLAVMQPFIRDGDVIYSWWAFEITRQGLDFGILLLLKMTVCVSAVILMSSVKSLPEILDALKQLKVPRFFITTLNMMFRYLHLFYDNLHRIRTAQKCRGFTLRNHPKGYRYVWNNLGNTISTLFIKSYDQGERVYTCMLARGYSMDSDYIFTEKQKVKRSDMFMFIGLGLLIIYLELLYYPILAVVF
jgi:cobalt/nickel transport system permease protein